jgi:hypothetical protein
MGRKEKKGKVGEVGWRPKKGKKIEAGRGRGVFAILFITNKLLGFCVSPYATQCRV